MDLPQRVAELDAAANALADEPAGGWLPRTIADAVAAKMAAEKPPRTAEALRDLFLSSMSGPALLAVLDEHFAGASRSDVFFGAVLAIVEFSGLLTLAQLELRIAQAERRVARSQMSVAA